MSQRGNGEFCRYSKEAAMNHLSPVKKRVKENTPPQKENISFSSKPASRNHHGSKSNKSDRTATASDLIASLDSPSPSANRTTMHSSSSGSEDELNKDSTTQQARADVVKCRTGSTAAKGQPSLFRDICGQNFSVGNICVVLNVNRSLGLVEDCSYSI